jgi:hypothetical protein
MFSLLEIKNSDTSSILNKALVIGDLLKIKTLNSEEKATLKKEAKD